MQLLLRSFFIVMLAVSTGCNSKIPSGFVYLADVDPTILQSMRYTADDNFIGRPIKGYEKPKTILTAKAADALKSAQEEFKKHGYSIVVYDAYRPQEAVDDFVEWSKDLSYEKMKEFYYPTFNKADLFELGYIAYQSGHTRGSTVDVTIIPHDKLLRPIQVSSRRLSNGDTVPFLDDGTVDMGSSFDLFHPVSNHDTEFVDVEVTARRNFLREIMKKHGFKEYKEEWWHYTLEEEPFPNTYFNFKIK